MIGYSNFDLQAFEIEVSTWLGILTKCIDFLFDQFSNIVVIQMILQET